MHAGSPNRLARLKAKPVVARELAHHDIDEIIACYLAESAVPAALGFIDALDAAYAHLGRYPATRSLQYAQALNLPGLRFWPLTRYPYLMLYLERPDHIDVWRVLHGIRDIPQRMALDELYRNHAATMVKRSIMQFRREDLAQSGAKTR